MQSVGELEEPLLAEVALQTVTHESGQHGGRYAHEHHLYDVRCKIALLHGDACVDKVQDGPYHGQCGTKLLAVLELLHRIDDKQRSARHEHALDKAGERQHDPQRPLGKEPLALRNQVLRANQ